MLNHEHHQRWRTDGKFFHSGGARVTIRAVTYGPFPGGWPEDFTEDFQRIATAGFNAIRTYEIPTRRLLDAAALAGLNVFGGLLWQQTSDFLRSPANLSAARIGLVEQLKPIAEHRAMAGIFVANEIPADLVRWMGPLRVKDALEDLIDLGREVAPDLLFAYANYPSTEYLEPSNADFTAFNVYLEDPSAYRAYLKRLHHIAGDRPLFITEFGLDSRRNGPTRQADTLRWAAEISHQEQCAGFTIYAWSDRWQNAGTEVLDWDFGLIDRQGRDKPALATLATIQATPLTPKHRFSVIVCTRNGRSRIGTCLAAIAKLTGNFETIVVDDGSDDATADWVKTQFPWASILVLEPCGLSAARNAGAAIATGEILAFTDDDCAPDAEWLLRLEKVFDNPRFAAAGGPNLPPAPKNWHEAVVCASPGAPSHVMLDDEEAEHLPGCNIAVKKSVFETIGGFDPQFRTAGDDVDFCWRLQDAGFHLGFSAGAFVWHWRRPCIREFLKQQIGYGRAERLLIAKHPHRFTRHGSAKWRGFIYGGGPIRITSASVIYYGPMGNAGYQSVQSHMQPLRDIAKPYQHWKSLISLVWVRLLAPAIRGWIRRRALQWPQIPQRPDDFLTPETDEFAIPGKHRESLLEQLLQDGWQPCGPTEPWDLEKNRSKLLIATELGDHGSKRSWIRIAGDPSLLRSIL